MQMPKELGIKKGRRCRVCGNGFVGGTHLCARLCLSGSQTFVLIIIKANCIIKNVKFILIFNYN